MGTFVGTCAYTPVKELINMPIKERPVVVKERKRKIKVNDYNNNITTIIEKEVIQNDK